MVGAATRPRAQGYGVSLGDEWFRIATTPQRQLQVYTRDSLAPRSDDQALPEENVLDIGKAFSRSNLTGGEGLDYYPRQSGEDSSPKDRIRFWDSANLEIELPDAGEPYGLKLTKASATWWTPGTAPVDMAASKDRIYVISGDTVYRFNDLTDTTPEDTDDINVTLVQVVASLDNSVAVLDANGDIWFKASQTEAYVRVYDSTVHGPIQDAKAIWLAKGRILAYCNDTATASDGLLLEIAPVITGTTGSPTLGAATTWTTVDTFNGFVTDLVDAGHAIVASLSDGSLRSYVPMTDTAGGTPELTVRGRAQVPIGEVPYRLGWNSGTLLVFTIDTNLDHARLYVGSVLDERFDFVAGGLQLIRTWKQSAETVPEYTGNVIGTRDSIFFWIGEGAADFNMWRYNMATGGLFRERADSFDTHPLGLVSFDDNFVFIVGANVVRTVTTYVASGYLITPNVTFGLNTPINWTSFVLEASDLAEAGAEVELYYATDPVAITDPNSLSWILVTRLSDIVNSGLEQNRINITSNTLALKLVLYRSDDATATPKAVRFAVRGFPKHRDWIAEVPVNISDYIEAPGRMPLHIPNYGDQVYTSLLNLQGASTTLTILDPPTVIRGVVDNILTPVPYISDRGSQGATATIVFRGARIAEDGGGSVSVGDAGLGVGTLGISTLGIGQT